jgi:hypothetical protein
MLPASYGTSVAARRQYINSLADYSYRYLDPSSVPPHANGISIRLFITPGWVIVEEPLHISSMLILLLDRRLRIVSSELVVGNS